MKTQFLIHVSQENNQTWVATCPTLGIASQNHRTREQSVNDIRNRLDSFLENEAKQYLANTQGNNAVVNCPDAFVLLPVDIWKCKLNKETCPLQGQVFMKDREHFLATCTAPRNRKEAIFSTIEASKYDGFHHIPGRYLCRLCHDEDSHPYYYPWELTMLNTFFDLEDKDFRIRVIRANIHLAVFSSAICPKCFISIVPKISSSLEKELEIIELSFFR